MLVEQEGPNVANDSVGRSAGAFRIPDRRLYERRPVRFACIDTGDNRGGAVLDISEGGLAVQSVLRFNRDSFSKIRFRLSASEQWVETSGTLIWLSKSQKIAGIAFNGLSNEARNRIKDWSSSSASAEASGNGPSGTEPFFETCRVAQRVTGPGTPICQTEEWKPEYIFSLRSWLVGLLAKTALLTMALVLIEPYTLHYVREPNLAKSSASGDIESSAPPDLVLRPSASTNLSLAPASGDPTFKEPTSGSLMLQVAAMRRKANAEALSNALRQKGFPVILYRSESTDFFVVATGPFDDLRPMNVMQTALKEHGFDSFAFRWPRQ
jgi:cell division septation protein DedD